MGASGTGEEAAAIRAALAAWRVQHPQATFDEIEDEVYRQLATLHGQWLGELAPPPHVAEAAAEAENTAPPRAGDPAAPRCGECGAALRPSGMRSRQVVTRMGATTRLTRRYWVCPACGAGHFPPG
jgi:hypothetical protein